MGLRCPACEGYNLTVIDSRASDDCIRRRRKCEDCGERFTTMESASTLKQSDLIRSIQEELMMNIGEAIRKTVEELKNKGL